MSIRCPVCGTVLQPESIPAVRNTSFQCPRCRTQLEVTASDPVPIFAASVMLSVASCVLMALRGFVLIAAILVVTAMLYWLGKLVRSFLAAPKLERSRSGDRLLHLAKRVHSSR
jgi:hypothetical protein